MAAPPASAGHAPSALAPTTQAYFVDTKKGEVSELKQLLKNITSEKDPKRKRDVIKKVIAYMTLGIDVSRLFTEMVMTVETRDLVVKKMVYLYLCNYAHAKPDLAIMSVNTLQRDCSSDDPMVRGLALRSLCSLRLPSMVEYISEPLRRSLTDNSPYVRKTGVMGILKLFHLAPEMVKNSNMADMLYDMLQDPDVQVVMNCLLVLTELLAEEGGMGVNQAIILHLLSRIGEFNEWGLLQVLGLVSKYEPVNEDETFTIMNLLDPVLRTSNSGVVLAAVKCFIHLTKDMPDLQPQVYQRVKAPLLTLMVGGNPEVEYCILKHLEAMIHQCPGVFDDEYRQLYVRYNEPSFVKYGKIDILALLANDASVNDIAAELAEYASDVDKEISRRAVRAIGTIAFRLPGAAQFIIEKLIEFLDMEINNVRAETILVMKDLLRKYPHRRADVLPSLQRSLRKVTEPEPKAAVIWMIGEYGEELKEAPYVIEPLIDSYAELESPAVKLALLTTSMKLFFKRPPEMQSMLGRLMAAATNDTSSQDVHDRALLYYRLLMTDVNVAREVVIGRRPKVVTTDFAEERDAGLRKRLYSEFNSLAIVYGQQSSQFISPSYQLNVQVVAADGGGAVADGANDSLLSAEDRSPRHPNAKLQRDNSGAGAGDYQQPEINLLDLDGLRDAVPAVDGTRDGGGVSMPPASSERSWALIEGLTMDAESFEALWSRLPDSGQFSVQLARLPPAASDLEAALAQFRVATLASGDLQDQTKLLLCGQDVDGDRYLVQAIIAKATRRMDVTVKAEKTTHVLGVDPAEAFVDQISQALFSLQLIG